MTETLAQTLNAIIGDPAVLNHLYAAAQLIHRQTGIDLSESYGQAWNNALMLAAESEHMDAFETTLVEAIRRAQAKQQGRAVRRKDVVIELDGMGFGGVDEWTISTTMSHLASRGIVQRPSDRKWAVAA